MNNYKNPETETSFNNYNILFLIFWLFHHFRWIWLFLCGAVPKPF